MTPPIQLLRHLPLFADLGRADLERIARSFKARTFAAGDTIAEQGMTGSVFFVISEGDATVSVHGRTVGRLKPGDSFGEIALVDENHVRTATVVADSAVSAYTLTAWDFDPLIDAYPSVARRLLQLLAARLRATQERDAEAPDGRT